MRGKGVERKRKGVYLYRIKGREQRESKGKEEEKGVEGKEGEGERVYFYSSGS